MTVEWFPMLKDVRFTHAWGGPLGMPRDWMPTTSYDAAAGVARAGGYTGQGVATANLFGRILTDLISGEVTPLTQLPTVNHRSPRWEPEPLRWLGIRYAQEGFARLDRDAEQTGKPRPAAPWWSALDATKLGEVPSVTHARISTAHRAAAVLSVVLRAAVVMARGRYLRDAWRLGSRVGQQRA